MNEELVRRVLRAIGTSTIEDFRQPGPSDRKSQFFDALQWGRWARGVANAAAVDAVNLVERLLAEQTARREGLLESVRSTDH